jgi:hypothetical protein
MRRKPVQIQAPKEGVSPELFEIVVRWLRQTYGSHPLTCHVSFELEHGLGQIERAYGAPPEPETGVQKSEKNGNLWR